MNKRPGEQPSNLKVEDHFITDPSQASLPTLQNNISKNNLCMLANNQSSQNAAANDSSSSEESNILVAIRVRPMIIKEINTGELNIIRAEDNLIVRLIFLPLISLRSS